MEVKVMRTLVLLIYVNASSVFGSLSVERSGNHVSLGVNGQIWLKGQEGVSEIGFHKDNEFLSVNSGTLSPSEVTVLSGTDSIGTFEGEEVAWDQATFYTSFRVYDHGNAVVFKQSFRNRNEDIGGTSVAALLDRALNEVSSVFPSFVPTLESKRGFLSFGGRMSGTPCITVAELNGETADKIRDGNYGGPLVLFNEAGNEVLILSPLSEFMITNLERRETNPGDVGALDFGLMGSITRIEAPGLNLEIIAAFGTNFQEAFQNWGNYLRGYHGKVIDQDKNDLVNDYLGYWTDNGAFYYYRTLEGKNYEETLIELTDFFKQSGASIPVRHLEIDSWWYPKDFLLAVEEWSALEDIFPNGLDFLQNRIGLPIVAHNRYWSRNTTYAKENGGAFDFIREIVAIPQDQDFWNYFFQEARKWGLKVYNQDWQDYQIALMNATVTDLRVSRNWLNQMALGAELNDIQIQYCMTLPKEAMASVETNSVTRIRVSEDYLLAEDQWRIGITSLFAHALGLKPFKDVFWTSSRNGGNNYYYDCMEVALDADPNVPWPLNYRYVGQASVTKSGHSCIPWSTLNLHYAYPLGDLVRNYCRNPVGLLAGNGRPFCFYEADLSKPMSEWKWENCDVTICDEDCTRDQSMVNATFPYCPELVEPNPELQAAVSTLSLGGVGFGDRMDAIDESVLAKTCREDGKILTVDEPALAAPVQLLEMAFSGLHLPENPTSSEIGEIWSSFVSLDGLIYGVVFGAENSISRPVTPWQLGLNLTPGVQYVVARHYNSESLILLDDSQELSLELMEEHEFELLYFVPMMEIEGFQIGLLGERQKFVPFSKDRFIGVGLSNQFLTLKSTGTTEVTLILKSQGELSSKTINCAESDSSAHVTYTYDLNTEESFCSFN